MNPYQQVIEFCGVVPSLGPTGNGWKIFQNPYELGIFVARMKAIGIRSVLEIGSGSGGLSRFMHDKLQWQVLSIDIKMPDYQTPGVIQWIGDSRTVTLPSMPFDLVFIDGNHAYDILASDYKRFAPLANLAVAIHDISGNWHCKGVRQFWRELAYEDNELLPGFHETIDPDNTKAAGIGWVEL